MYFGVYESLLDCHELGAIDVGSDAPSARVYLYMRRQRAAALEEHTPAPRRRTPCLSVMALPRVYIQPTKGTRYEQIDKQRYNLINS